VLSPQNNGISSIAKQNAANEADIMISKYNSGQISNADMKAFFEKQLASPYVSQNDKIQIQTKLVDFDSLIQKDQLEATFRSAPDNSIAKAQAATALAKFFTDRASQMQPGTPAHSQALQNAGEWQNTVQSINENVNKLQRKNLENTLLQQVNQKATSSSDRSLATAEMYKKLYDMAVAQGDVADAQAYAAKYEQAQTMAEQYGAQEQQKQSVAEIKQFAAEQDLAISKLTDKTPEELKAKAEKAYAVAQKYADIGDQLNYTKYMTIGTQAEEKYNKKITTDRGAVSSAEWDKEDYKLSNGLQLAQKFLKDGQTPDGQAYTPEDYQNDVGNLVQAKAIKISERIQIIDEMAANDPNQKIKYDGSSRRVADVLEQLRKEEEKIQPQADAIQAGTFAIMEVAPSKFTKAGAYKTSGKNVPEYQIIDTNNIPEGLKDLLVADDQGIYHQAYFKEQQIPTEQFDPYDPTMRYDKATNKAYKQTGEKVVDLYQQDKSKIGQTQIVSPDQPVKSLETIQREAEQTYQDTAVKKQKELEKPTVVPDLIPTKPALQQLAEGIKTTAQKIIPQNIIDTVSKSPIEVGKELVQPKKVEPVVNKTPVNIQQATQSGGLTVNKPQPVQQAPAITYSTPAPKIEYKAPTPVNITQAVQSGGLSTPVKATPAPQQTTLQKIGTTITGAAGQAVNKLKSLFKW
jgi:hypothetical protein